MISGRTLSDRLDGHARRLDSEKEGLSREIVRIERTAATLRDEEAEAWTRLAGTRLGLRESLPPKVAGLVRERDEAIAAAESAILAADAEFPALMDGKTARERDVASAEAALATARAKLETEIAADARMAGMLATNAGLASSLAVLEDKLRRARSEADLKGPAFEQDEFFVYLRDRGFGTDSYSSIGVIRNLDRWLASLIGFDEAAADYRRLMDIPGWVAERLEEARKKAAASAAAVARLRAEFEQRLAPLVDGVSEARTRLDELAAEIDLLVGRRRKAKDFLDEAAQGTDAHRRKIIGAFVSLLEETDPARLREMAEASQTRDDDAELAAIEQLRLRHGLLATEVAHKRSELAAISKRLDGLREVERKLRGKRWHGSSDEFRIGDSDGLFERLAAGSITGDAVWDRIASTHVEPPPPSTTHGSSGGFGGSDSWSSGGSFGGSSSSSSWSTGGGFGGSDGGSSSGGGFGGD